MIQRVTYIAELRRMKKEMDEACERGDRAKMLELCDKLIEMSDEKERDYVRCS